MSPNDQFAIFGICFCIVLSILMLLLKFFIFDNDKIKAA